MSNLKQVSRFFCAEYRKSLTLSPGIIFVQKAFLLGLFSGELILEGLVIGRNFAFQNGFGMSIKTAKTLRQQPKTDQNS